MEQISQRGPKQRVLASACLLLMLLLLSDSGAQAWRAFDALDGVRHFNTDYFQPPPSPFMTNFYTNSQPINLAQFDSSRPQQKQAQAPQTQLLTPASAQVARQFEAPPQAQLNNFQEQPLANSLNQQQQNPPEAQQEFTKQDLAHDQPHQLEVREVPTIQIASTRAPAGNQQPVSVAPSPAPPSSDAIGRDISQVTPSEAPRKFELQPQAEGAGNEFQQKPSPFGKILDSLYQPTSAANATGDKQAAKSQDTSTSKPALQLLKPRKPSEPRKTTPAAIEQQIIDQHARTAAGYNSHSSTPQPQQRLVAVTKNRGQSGGPNRLGAILLNSLGVLAGSSSGSSSSSSSSSLSFHEDPTSSSSNSQQQLNASPIARIMDNFKSGISSRSSIMKAAISENKLARTLTSVGKTLGGNKYVASAGIAAALAALGLTVGKYLSPYSLSSGAQYSKISADPLLPSGSLEVPFFGAAGNYAPNERLLSQWAGGSNPYNELTATSSSNMPATYELPSSSNYAQFDFQQQQPGIDQAALNQIAAAAGLYPGSQHAYTGPESAAQNFMSQQSQVSSQFWPPPVNYQVLRPATSQKSAWRESKPFGTANGHYSNFYNQPEIEAATSDNSDQSVASSMPIQTQEPQQQAPQQQQPQQQYGAYISGAPTATNYQEQIGFSSESRQQQQPGSSEQSQVGFDQLPQASLESVAYQKAPAVEQPQQQQQPAFSAKRRAGSTGRRSGAVILKLDEATRSRLEQLSASQRNKQAVEPAAYANYFVLSTPTDQQQQQQAGGGVAQQASLSRSTRAHQAQLFAPPPQPPSAMTNRPQWSPSTAAGQQAPSPSKSALEQASEEGQLSASGGQLLDSITNTGAKRTQESKWRQASQNKENTGPTAAALTKQSVPEYQFIRPTSGQRHQAPAADQIVFGFADEHAKVSPAQAQPQPQPQPQTAPDGGWKSIDVNSPVDGAQTAKSQSAPDETARSEYARADDPASSGGGQLHRVSRTPGRTSRHSAGAAPAEQHKLTGERLQQMVALMNQQRALAEAEEEANANELQTGALRDGAHLFAAPVAVGSIRNKSGQMGGKWNEVVQPTATLTKTTLAPQQDNDKAPKSTGAATQLAANESVDANEAPIDADNKQSAPATPQQAASSDNVRLELVDAGELLGAESNANSNVAAAAPANQKPPGAATKREDEPAASQRQQADADQPSESDANDNDDQQQLGRPRAYRGLVAGSIGANAAN